MLKNNKSLGQHWLKDRFILDGIADLSAIPDIKTCVEIGPGLGTLTSSLLKKFDKVVAVEYDENLAKNLPKSFPGTNLGVVNEDILKFDFSKIKDEYVVAGNIPYYITSPIIMKLIHLENKPKRIVLLVQKEVAKRITAGAGDRSVLSLTVQNRANVIYEFDVKKEFFTPMPKVDSAVISLELAKPTVSDNVIDFIKVGFKSPRKKLIHNLPGDKEKLKNIFAELNIAENTRPADLSLDDWKKLFENLS